MSCISGFVILDTTKVNIHDTQFMLSIVDASKRNT